MRLSDAIALGRVTITELRAAKLDGCALGMAANAVGISRRWEDLERQWPWLWENTAWSKSPCDCCLHATVAPGKWEIVTHLFDSHVMLYRDMTLDQLIDRVREMEPPEPVEAEARPESEPTMVEQFTI